MPRRRRPKRQSHIGSYVILLLVGLFVIVISYFALNAKPPSQPQQSGTVDYFTGAILDQDFQGKVSGVVEADTNCVSAGHGHLTTCIAIINTEIGTLQFKYTHDMAAQACLTTNDKVDIQYQGSGITQIARRLA